MFFFGKSSIAKENAAKAAAISKSHAVVELGLDGTVITANENCLKTFGYTLNEIQGKHHGMFVEASERSSPAYREFWIKLELRRASIGRVQTCRQGRQGDLGSGFLQSGAGLKGKPTKVVELATDITAKKIEALENAAQVAAIERSQAVAAFNLDGTIITANKNFLNAMGYALGEVQGKHDSMFVEPAERASAAYREFWAKLNRGESQSAEYRRIGKGGKEVWIQATYSPIADENGRLCKVVTFATDVTKQKLRMADLEGQMAAIDKSQAVVEFGMDGTVTTANDNFLKTLGYSVKEIQGKHHGMFVEASERSSLAYREFWTKLNRGEPQSAEYKRVGKDGKEIWVQASYNPVLDSKGKPTKVVELATDITAKKIEALENAAQVAAIERSQAVAAFNPDGTIITANKNFLNAMGYALGEVQGKHDSMFVEPAERASAAYREFWAKLNRGESQSAEYKRIGKNGKEVWIHALYSPILGLNGRPLKIVTYVKEMSASIREIYETMIKPEESVHAAAIGQGFAGEIATRETGHGGRIAELEHEAARGKAQERRRSVQILPIPGKPS